MSKLNPTGKNVANDIRAVAAKRGVELGYSANGNLQFKKEPLQMLYELAVSTLFGKSNQLKSADKLVQDLRKHVKTAVDMGAYDFVANLAIHARGEMNIRTIPVVMVVEFAKAISDKRAPTQAEIKRLEAVRNPGMGTNLTNAQQARIAALRAQADSMNYKNMRLLVTDVIQRADQITDLYAYALDVFGGKDKIPMAIKRGVADAFSKFGEYNFAKYNRDGAVKFRDVLRIVHPEAKTPEVGVVFEKIMKDALEAPYTWEVELSRNGQLPVSERKTEKQLWTELVTSGKVGYMALLRNLRNIDKAGLDADVLRKHVLDVIADPVRVAKSKQLPFDFIEAYNIVKTLNPRMASAVSEALDHSVLNMPALGDSLWLIIDYSGSMGQNDGKEIQTATLLAAAVLKANRRASNLAVTLFGSSAMTLKGVDTNNSVLAIQKELLTYRKGNIAGSTDFNAALREQSKLGFVPDTVLVKTDGEVNRFPYSATRQVGGKDTMKITFNLSAANTTPMTAADGWYTMAGWSPAMFKWVPAMRDKESVVDQLSVPYIGVPEKVHKTKKVVEGIDEAVE